MRFNEKKQEWLIPFLLFCCGGGCKTAKAEMFSVLQHAIMGNEAKP
jgi:hypothetical protein